MLRREGAVRSAFAAFAGFASAVLAVTVVWPPRPLLVWNASASAPIGLYGVGSPRKVRPGDTVIAWPPAGVGALAAERRYLPSNVPLVKRVSSAAGDRVCAAGEAIWVNGRYAAHRRAFDGRGRPMPSWTGCRTLSSAEYLLLNDSPDSFDGRYFGVTQRDEIVGRAVLLWAR